MKCGGVLCVAFVLLAGQPAWAMSDMDRINAAVFDENAESPDLTVKAQILLDRTRYSPGAIDGLYGDATQIALKAFQADHGLSVTGKLDEATFIKLSEGHTEPVLTRYKIEPQDVNGPFAAEIPDRIEDMARLKILAFTGPLELLAERFHMDEALLQRLNPDADFTKSGTEIVVAAIEVQKEGRDAAGAPKAQRIVVDKTEGTLRVLGKNDDPIAVYAATIGGENTPTPDGEAKIRRIARGPSWNYDPRLELEGYEERPDQRMTVPAGPNNPVGTVWIAIDRDHYGIHGTADPTKVGKNISSGCVRLTNWDVEELAGLVRKGMPVLFVN